MPTFGQPGTASCHPRVDLHRPRDRPRPVVPIKSGAQHQGRERPGWRDTYSADTPPTPRPMPLRSGGTLVRPWWRTSQVRPRPCASPGFPRTLPVIRGPVHPTTVGRSRSWRASRTGFPNRTGRRKKGDTKPGEKCKYVLTGALFKASWQRTST